jgi:YidC/Oxa1 family membrane protein insertase
MFNTIVFIPLTNALVFLTSFLWGNIGLAVIVLTILIKLILLPLSYAQTKSQIAIKKIQPLINDIKKNTPDKTEQTQKIMALYKEHNTNPLSGCLPLIIQLPIIIALYQVFLQGASVDGSVLYSFVHAPEHISNFFLGINMTEKSIIVALIAGIAQYFQLKLSPSMKEDPAAAKNDNPDMQTAMMANMQKTMKYSLPIMITVFAAIVPAAVALYWVITSLFQIAQEYWINKKVNSSTIIKI